MGDIIMNKYIYALVASQFFITSNAIAASNAEDPILHYYIPKTTVAAQITQRITKCSVEGGNLLLNVHTQLSLKPGVKPDYSRAIAINAKSKFLVNKSTKLTFNPDGTLKSLNGTATGQGGPVLSAVIQTGATIAAITTAPPAAAFLTIAGDPNIGTKSKEEKMTVIYVPSCKVSGTIETLRNTQNNLKKAREKIINGEAGQAIIDEISRLEKEVTKYQNALTIKQGVTLTPATKTQVKKMIFSANISAEKMANHYSKWIALERKLVSEDIKNTDYNAARFDSADLLTHLRDAKEPSNRSSLSDWSILTSQLNSPLEPYTIAGVHGLKLSITAVSDAYDTINNPKTNIANSKKKDDNSKKKNAAMPWEQTSNRDFYYVRPVPAKARFYACANPKCDKAVKGQGASKSENILLPQLSKLFKLSPGGSIFATKTVAATFGPYGEPLTLEYTKGGGGAEIASVINAGGQAATTIDGAKLKATQDEIARINAERELDALLAGNDNNSNN